MRRMASIGAAVLMLAILFPPGTSTATHRKDPFYPFQWNLHRIGVPSAWKFTQGEGATIAVIDDIVDYHHEELRGKVRLVFGRDGGVCRPPEHDCGGARFQIGGGHGTFVASIAAARRNNGVGIAGVAPEARLLSAHYSGVPLHRSIRWAARHGADVINMSLGVGIHGVDVGPLSVVVPGLVESAIGYAWKKGAVIVAAAGNELLPLCESMHRKMLCVGALDQFDVKTWYSNFGFGVHLWGPGGIAYSLRTCDPNDPLMKAQGLIVGAINTGSGEFCGKTGYWTWYGTSFATPHVSGVAALLASIGMNNKQIVRCLKRTADDIGPPGVDPIYNYGRVNAYRAIKEC